MTREELELHAKWLDLKERYIAAKQADRDSDECKAAKAEMSAFRRYWREIREAFADEPGKGDAVAAPETIRASVAVNEKG